MRYLIKQIKSRGKSREIIILFACVTIYFLCFMISDMYENYSLPEWFFKTYKKLPK